MSRTWMVIDGNALAWAAFHTTGGLHYRNTPTGVAYGFLGRLMRLKIELDTDDVAICFDYGKSLRYKLLPEYKATRQKRRDEDERARAMYASASMQMDKLRTEYLEDIGFRNVLYEKGYEADDMIASVCRNLRNGDKAIVVSTDSDMLQLLSRHVSVYIPTEKRRITRKLFRLEYGISPKQWVDVKCLAGCSSDDVPGIKGIGEKTALRYLRGDLNPKSVAHGKIRAGLAQGIMERNRPLVELPFNGTPECHLLPDRDLDWQPTLRRLNFKSLEHQFTYRE